MSSATTPWNDEKRRAMSRDLSGCGDFGKELLARPAAT